MSTNTAEEMEAATEETSASKIEESEMTPFLRKLSVFCSGGPWLDGYILTIIGAALVQLEPQLGLTSQWSGLIGAASLAGLFIGGGFFGYLTDIIGRVKMFEYDLVLLALVSILQMFVQTPIQLVILRFIAGIAIGADYPIATSLLAEFSPKKHRGFMLGILMAVYFFGCVCADIVGYFLLEVPNGWKWMLGSAAIPAIILVIGRIGTPESPRWLLSKNRVEEARAVVKKVYGPDADLPDIDQEVVKTKFSKLFEPFYLKRIVFIGGYWLCQIVPLFGVYIFGPKILAMFGLAEGNQAMLGEIVLSVAFLAGVGLALKFMGGGRRPLIIWSFVFMTIGMLILSVFTNAGMWVVIGGFVIYALASGGPNILEWLYPNELFPTEIRATGTGVATAISRIGTCITTYALPGWLASLGLSHTMWILTVVTFVGLIICIFLAPETKGLTLAEASGSKKE